VAWSGKTSATQLTDVTTEQFFDQTPTLTPGELLSVEIEADFPGSPTDNLLVKCYGTLDDSTESWDDLPFFQITINNGIDPSKVSFAISGVYKFRIGVQRDGSTDTIPFVDMAFRADQVDL
jgi:hypothetical protein